MRIRLKTQLVTCVWLYLLRVAQRDKLHSLRGEEKERWSVWVNGNWRAPFEFRDGHAYVLDYEDYH
jgi:plasmid maintenance system killer protein